MNNEKFGVCIGYDKREMLTLDVCMKSIWAKTTNIPVHVANYLNHTDIYTRPAYETGDGVTQLWDTISNAPMSTQFSLIRFYLHHLPGVRDYDWVLFADCDFLFTRNLWELFELRNPAYAVQCVKHRQRITEPTKMRGVQQTEYPRKNWSSLMLWNMKHVAHQALSLEYLNTALGSHLHQFRWLADSEIGELPSHWNFLVGVDSLADAALTQKDPLALPGGIHYTLGTPPMRSLLDELWIRVALNEPVLTDPEAGFLRRP